MPLSVANPFPGMNPYLENPRLWRGVHTSLIVHLANQLNRVLPEQFVARIEERVYLVHEERSVYPDLLVFRRVGPEPVTAGGGQASSGGGRTVRVEPVEISEPYIEIREVGTDEVVTVVEILSPANKLSREGREEYQDKQQRLRRSDVDLLEIDLLRSGGHIVGVPEYLVRETMLHWDYIACLQWGRRRWEYTFWANRLAEPLPEVVVPLGENNPLVSLDLQAGINQCYLDGMFVRSLDYREEPIPLLSTEDSAWADALLREYGLRN